MAMASSKIKYGSNAIFYTTLTVGILVLVNLVASRVFTRLDLTEDQIYTISAASKKLVADLPDRVTVKAFLTGELPAGAENLRGAGRYLRDMLEEFATSSGGKMVWEAMDPSVDEKAKEEARRLKIQPVNLTAYSKTGASVSQAYLGVAFQYGGKVEPIQFINPNNLSSLEYQISSTIRRLSSKRRKVGFTGGHGEPSLHQGLQIAKQALKDFEVTTVNLSEGKTPVPDDVDMLIMVGPKQRFSERATYELDQFLMKGKGLAVFFDGMTLETPRGQFPQGQLPPRIARSNVVGLRDQLAYYGVKINEDLIMDRRSQMVVLQASQTQRVMTKYPAFPIVMDLDRKIPITRDLRAYVSVFPSSLEVTQEVRAGKAKVRATVLAKSSQQSWRQTGFFLFDPMRQPQPTKEIGPFDLAVYLEGTFSSFFAGKPVPEPGPPKPPRENAPRPSGKGQKSPDGTRLVVVADSELIQDGYIRFPGNGLLLQNVVDYLAEDEALIRIRAKSQTRRPFEKLEDRSVTLAKWGNIVLLPVAFILVGVVRWRWRTAARKRRARLLTEGK